MGCGLRRPRQAPCRGEAAARDGQRTSQARSDGHKSLTQKQPVLLFPYLAGEQRLAQTLSASVTWTQMDLLRVLPLLRSIRKSRCAGLAARRWRPAGRSTPHTRMARRPGDDDTLPIDSATPAGPDSPGGPIDSARRPAATSSRVPPPLQSAAHRKQPPSRRAGRDAPSDAPRPLKDRGPR